jgi:phosphatidylglycerophosphate synthase
MAFAALGGLSYLAILWFPSAAAPCLLGGVAGAQLRLVCNLLDGMVAVEGGLKGRAGDLYNEAPDRFADLVLLVAAGSAGGAIWLGWMAGAGAVSTAYIRAFGASLGQGQDFCGPCAKQHRMFLLTVGSLAATVWPPALIWTLWVIAIGSFATTIRRVARLYAKLP